VNRYSQSYDKDGRETPLSRSVPNDRLGILVVRAGTCLAFYTRHSFNTSSHLQTHSATTRSDSIPEASVPLPAGCAIEPVDARATILNYPRVASSRALDDGGRATVWMAPDPGCFPVRSPPEVRQPDGPFVWWNGRKRSR
jgi:hypothetical protein